MFDFQKQLQLSIMSFIGDFPQCTNLYNIIIMGWTNILKTIIKKKIKWNHKQSTQETIVAILKVGTENTQTADDGNIDKHKKENFVKHHCSSSLVHVLVFKEWKMECNDTPNPKPLP